MDRWMDGWMDVWMEKTSKEMRKKERVRSCVGGDVDAERGVLASGRERRQKRGAKWKKGRVTNAAAGGKKAHKGKKKMGDQEGSGWLKKRVDNWNNVTS